jgi:hypothetical protein
MIMTKFYIYTDFNSGVIEAKSASDAARLWGLPTIKMLQDGATMTVRNEDTYEETVINESWIISNALC